MSSDNKVIIYQLMPRWFGNTCQSPVANGSIKENGVGKLNDIDESKLQSIGDLGTTHVWFTGVIKHATQTSYNHFGIKPNNPFIVKGKAGSPYAIDDYYDIDPDLAVDIDNRMQEFEQLIMRTHKQALKVIIDFVPNHVAREYCSQNSPVGMSDLGEDDDKNKFFDPQNNFYYIQHQTFAPAVFIGEGEQHYHEFPAKATGNDCFTACPTASDWYETVKLNYGIDPWNGSKYFSPIPNTWHKMLNILMFWAGKGVDGFRCDMAHMVPVEFWHWAIAQVKQSYPQVIFIAEIYDTALYRSFIEYGGFDYLYDKVTLYDTLCGIMKGTCPASQLTWCWQSLNGLQPCLLSFLENHDEPRLASPHHVGNVALTIPALVVAATLSTGAFMFYAGQELGEPALDVQGYSGDDGRTSIFDYCTVPSLVRWHNKQLKSCELDLQKRYRHILNLCHKENAIAQGQFFDLMYVNTENLNPIQQFAYLRHFEHETLLIVVNFDEQECAVQLTIPQHAFNHLSLKEGQYNAHELLHDKNNEILLTPHNKVPVHIAPHDAIIWKFTVKQ